MITDHTLPPSSYGCVIIDEVHHTGLGTMLMDQHGKIWKDSHGVLHTTDAQEFLSKIRFCRPPEKLAAIMQKS